ncbi:MAG: phosphatidylglycerophosphatase A [Acidobacteriota bacterium]
MTRPATINREKLSAPDRLAYAIATGFGAGFAPVAPGTLGAIEGVALFLAFIALSSKLSLSASSPFVVLALVNVAIFTIGVWASNRFCEISGVKDPSQIVIDEISGQLIALTPLAASPSAAGVIAAFVLFRLFDIFKPYPIRKLEALPGGWGVMSDDALAGVYAAVIVTLTVLWKLI